MSKRCETFQQVETTAVAFWTKKISKQIQKLQAKMMDGVLRMSIEESSKAAGDFTKVYYESLDKKRHQMSRLYMDNAIAVWNGNDVIGKDNIQQFFINLPDIEHTVTTYDVQPIIDEAIANQQTLLLIVAGTIRFKKHERELSKPFQQTFMITAEGGKWKIVRDCFRIQDALSTLHKK